ncbi:PREDICTED: E3 ubiquitin-protein ligase SMURF2-like [Priapulus caudatus]|uniref:HECT-type E3 ubiquitin transferase n=1 Tax=Priapulus caudatus TaxID=37621 RepID=A0ABM1EL13_PRICU|nr:PREDICTED: E3 ubiquitin-protein ligase SMURF2-like [Priapulus caudatus]
MSSSSYRQQGKVKLRITILCAKNLTKKDFFRLPDPFVRISVDGTGQVHNTETCKNSMDPKWNQHYDLYVGRSDSITISVWNHKKIHKRAGAGFLGCVRITSNALQRLKDTGYQRLDLCKKQLNDPDPVRGQVVVSIMSRDRGSSDRNAVTDSMGNLAYSMDPNELPEGWEERRTLNGRVQYLNHVTRSVQWERPTRPAAESVAVQPQAVLPNNNSVSNLSGGQQEAPPSRPLSTISSSNQVALSATTVAEVHVTVAPPATSNSSSGVHLSRRAATPAAAATTASEPATRTPSCTAAPPSSVQRPSYMSPNNASTSAISGGSSSAVVVRGGSSGTAVTTTMVTVAPVNSGAVSVSSNNATVPGSATVPSSASVPISATVPNRTSVPVSATVPNRTSVPVSATVPNRTSVPVSATVSNRTSVPVSATVPNRPTVPSSVPVPNRTSVPVSATVSNRPSVPVSATVPNRTSVPVSATVSNRPSVPVSATVPNRTSVPVSATVSNRPSVPVSATVPNRTSVPVSATFGLLGLDFLEQRTTNQGQVYFLHVATGVSTWHDPRVPRDVGSISENDLGPMPPGWEVRYTANGRKYYVDHNNRTTQFTDPRLSSNIHIIRNSKDKDKENDSPVPKYKRDLVQKLKNLRAELQSLQPQTGHCRIEVSREEIFEESYRQIMKMRPKDLRKRLMIKFKSEEGLDYGGIAREWLYLLSHEMLNPYYGLFQYSRDDIYTLQINTDSAINPEHLSYFHFVGRVIGMAVFHAHYIDGGFTLPFYKQLLNKPITLDDIEEVDPDLYRSMIWILENDISDVMDHTFTVMQDSFGELQVYELKPEGSSVAVTEENKKEYVRLYVNWRYMRGIEAQFLALQKGYNELIPQHFLKSFDEKELELVISGLGKIDLDDWKVNTRLKHCTPDSGIVQWFWKMVESYSDEQKARLLQFVTGSSRVPIQGFKALQGSTGAAGPRLFTIHQIDASSNNLPKAHTCFNRIDIPPYETYDKLYEKITCAVEETCGFTVE